MDSLSNSPLRRAASQRIPASLTSLSFPYSVLGHLPVSKREQLQQVVGIILSAISPVKPAMIMLFGAYARGDWLQTAEYESCFDLWVIMEKAPLVQKIARKTTLYNQLNRDVETPVHVLVEDVQGIERRIGKEQWIYTDRLQESIVLYGSGIHSFTHFSRLSVLQKRQQASQKKQQTFHRKQKASHRKQKAGADFHYWFAKANVYRVYAKMAFKQGDYNEAAFFLHQSVERFYATVLWVFGGYSSSSHDLQQLHQLVASLVPQFLQVFPQTIEEKAMFEQLRQAYVDARYKPSFSMDQPTLEWLLTRVHLLKQLTKEVCQVRITSYYD